MMEYSGEECVMEETDEYMYHPEAEEDNEEQELEEETQ